MLITFKSKSAAEVLMYESHAKPILDLLGKSPERGVITAEETGDAIRRIENEIAERRAAEAAQQRNTDDQNESQEDQEDEGRRAERVSFSTRVYPLLEMLRAANREGEFVMWGV